MAGPEAEPGAPASLVGVRADFRGRFEPVWDATASALGSRFHVYALDQSGHGGLAHMADDLKKYAARTACPVVILRGSHSSELTAAQVKDNAACWTNAAVVEVDGDYALHLENPAGLARALADFAEQAVGV